MSFMDKLLQLKDMIRGDAEQQGKPKYERMSNLSTGGFAGYKPQQGERHRRSARSPQNPQPEQQAAEYYGQQPWGPQTGMQQPSQPQGGYQPQNGFVSPQADSNGYVQQPYSYTQNSGSMYSGPYQGNEAQSGQWAPPAQPETSQPVRPQGMPDNVIPMPGLQQDAQGQVWKHREIVAQPTSAATCYRLIEFMHQGMTVIVNTELIADQREVQRCLDILFGAAFTMDCGFHRIAARSIYMITPRNVSVDAYENIRQVNNEDIGNRWPGAEGMLFPETVKKAVGGGAYRPRESFGGAYAAGRR